MSNQLPLAGLFIDNKCLGNEMILLNSYPYYMYKNNVKTEQIEGFSYVVLLPNHGYNALSVKIPGNKILQLKIGQTLPVQFENLTLKIYLDSDKKPRLSAKASGIKVVG